MRVGFLTTNLEKLRELKAIVAQHHPSAEVIAITPAEDIEETGQTFEANALLKLDWGLQQGVMQAHQLDVLLAEDSGLVVKPLDGTFGLSPFPGVLSNRWLTPQRQQDLLGDCEFETVQKALNAALLKLLATKTQREAYYVCALAVATMLPNETLKRQVYEGQFELTVGECETGSHGFGYDPIMCLPNSTTSIASLPPEEKNSRSHRYKAIIAWLSA